MGRREHVRVALQRRSIWGAKAVCLETGRRPEKGLRPRNHFHRLGCDVLAKRSLQISFGIGSHACSR